ncbi:MAG: hypothetical protein JWO19_5237 [Bryobacterales bacterium]|jgi:hypothetical protein|nr:hypothetical protein [Bryobacterales bacterium]
MKLTIEQHREIAQHLHFADSHLYAALRLMCPGDGTTNVPLEIVTEIERLRDDMGAASSPSRHSAGDILHQCQAVLFSEHPGQTFEVYYTYQECGAVDKGRKPSSEGE